MAKKIFGKMLDLIGLEETTLEEEDYDAYDDYYEEDSYNDGYNNYDDNYYDDSYEEEDFYEEEKPARSGLLGRRKESQPSRASMSRERERDNNLVGLPGGAGGGRMRMIVYQPMTYDDTQNIIDNLKKQQPIIVNLESLELETAQRILDFMSGAVYALNGSIQKVSKGIFVLVPINVDVTGNIPDELQGKSFHTLGNQRRDY